MARKFPRRNLPYSSFQRSLRLNGNAEHLPVQANRSQPRLHESFALGGEMSVLRRDPHLKTPYTYQYNLSLQRENLAKNTVLELTYLGSSSHGLTGLQDVNPFVLGTTDRILNLAPTSTTCPDETAGNPSLLGCTFNPILEFRNVTKASYNGLVTSLTKQIDDSPLFGRNIFPRSATPSPIPSTTFPDSPAQQHGAIAGRGAHPRPPATRMSATASRSAAVGIFRSKTRGVPGRSGSPKVGVSFPSSRGEPASRSISPRIYRTRLTLEPKGRQVPEIPWWCVQTLSGRRISSIPEYRGPLLARPAIFISIPQASATRAAAIATI